MTEIQITPEQPPAQNSGNTPAPTIDPVSPTATKQNNVVGLVAFIISVVGFLFACIPGALIIGWVLLPVAFILGIVGLVLHNRKRAFALTALIVSVVGTIVGIVVFFAVVAASFSSALGGGETTVAGPTSAAQSKEKIAAATTDDATTKKSGARDDPAALGSTITGNDYTVVINSVALDANAAVAAANEFNDAAPAGSSYAVVNATITYTGDDSGYAAFVGIDYVTASGNVVTSSDNLAVAPDPQLGLQELYKGATTTGNVVLAIPDGDTGLLRVRPGVIANEVFVAIK